MKYLNKSIKSLLTCLVILALGSSAALAAKGGTNVTVSLSASPSTIDEGQPATVQPLLAQVKPQLIASAVAIIVKVQAIT